MASTLSGLLCLQVLDFNLHSNGWLRIQPEAFQIILNLGESTKAMVTSTGMAAWIVFGNHGAWPLTGYLLIDWHIFHDAANWLPEYSAGSGYSVYSDVGLYEAYADLNGDGMHIRDPGSLGPSAHIGWHCRLVRVLRRHRCGCRRMPQAEPLITLTMGSMSVTLMSPEMGCQIEFGGQVELTLIGLRCQLGSDFKHHRCGCQQIPLAGPLRIQVTVHLSFIPI